MRHTVISTRVGPNVTDYSLDNSLGIGTRIIPVVREHGISIELND